MDSIHLEILNSRRFLNWEPCAAMFAAWLHFDSPFGATEKRAISAIISAGCRYILITGPSHVAVHEEIDYLAMEQTKDLVLTSSRVSPTKDAAFEFLLTNCPAGPPDSRLICAFSHDLESEFGRVADMMKVIASVLREFAKFE